MHVTLRSTEEFGKLALSPRSTLRWFLKEYSEKWTIRLDHDLLFAYDCPRCHKPLRLQHDLGQLANRFRKIGLEMIFFLNKMHKEKISRRRRRTSGWHRGLGNAEIWQFVLDTNNVLYGEFGWRLRIGWNTLCNTRTGQPEQRLPMNVRANIFRTVVDPAMLYAKHGPQHSRWRGICDDRKSHGKKDVWLNRKGNEQLRRRFGIQNVVSKIHAAKEGQASQTGRRSTTAGPVAWKTEYHGTESDR